MKKVKRSIGIVLALFLAVAIVAGIGTLAKQQSQNQAQLPVAGALSRTPKASSGITFLVPELIYLTPNLTSTNTFQYYVDSASNGTLNTSRDKTTGVVYFKCDAAASSGTNVTITASGATNLTWKGGTTQNNTTYSGEINGGKVSDALSQGQVSYITWTATYKVAGETGTRTATAKTAVYAPYCKPVGAAVRASETTSTANFASGVAYVDGVHGYDTSVNKGNYDPSSNTNNSKRILYTMGASQTAPGTHQRVDGWLVGPLTDANADKGSIQYQDYDYTGDYVVYSNSPYANLSVDTSRYTNLNQVPNLKAGFLVTDTDKGSTEKDFRTYYIDYTDGAVHSANGKGTGAVAELTRGGYVDYNTQVTMINGNKGTLTWWNTWTENRRTYDSWARPISGTGNQLFRAKAFIFAPKTGNNSIVSAASMCVYLDVDKVSKSALRNNLREYTNKGLLSSDYTSDSWNALNIALMSAYEVLGHPRKTSAEIEAANSALVTAYEGLTPIYTATVSHRSQNGQINEDETIRFAPGDSISFGTKAFTGYVPESASGQSTSLNPQTVNPANSNISQTYNYRPISYSAKYHANGGTGTMADSTYTYDVHGTLRPNEFTRDGYKFIGWTTQAGGTVVSVPVDLDVYNITSTDGTVFDLYAVWEKETYKVTFKSNYTGSNQNDHTQDFIFEETKNLTANTFSRQGYTFAGWNTQANGNGTSYGNGDPFTMGAGNVDLHAQWDANEYMVTFVPGSDATVNPASKSVTYDAKYGELPTPSRTGYTFVDWYADAELTQKVDANSTVTTSADHSLYAKWTINQYAISFNANGGTLVSGDLEQTVNHGSTPVEPTVSKDGYTFDGWDKEVLAATENTTYTAKWKAKTYTITFKLENGSADVTVYADHGSVPVAPSGFSKDGYGFAGWNPALTEATEDATYTAQWVKTGIALKLIDNEFVVDIYGWNANEKYQIWTYQTVTSDDLLNLDTNVPANQWLLTMAYTSGSNGTLQVDGSIRFALKNSDSSPLKRADFNSPTENYLVAVRVADAQNSFLREIRDSFTPGDVGEPVITKVLVDGEVTTGYELREIDGNNTVIEVIGNLTEMEYSANVISGVTPTTVTQEGNKFTWNLSTDLRSGIYIVEIKAMANGVEKTYEIKYQIYKTENETAYGYIDNLDFEYSNGFVNFNMIYGTESDRNDYGNGSFSYRLREPGRKPFYRSDEFTQNEAVTPYELNKPGIYEIDGYVTRLGYVGTEANGAYDDGIIRNFVVPRPGVNPKDIKLTLTADHSLPDFPKNTPVIFTANAEGLEGVQYSFWRYDATGYVLVKDWSVSNELKWTPARVGTYTLQVRAKGAGAGSYEIAKSIEVNVTDTSESKANVTDITLNVSELQSNAQPRKPIMLKANATATNGDDLLYKFYVYDKDLRTRELKGYSIDQTCVWTPRKPGVYTISVLVKNQVSYGKYDAIESYEITVE